MEAKTMDIAEKLNNLREQNELTLYRVAALSGLSHNTVSNIFSGISYPRIDTLEQILKVFDVSLAQFFSEDEKCVYLTDSQVELFKRWDKLSAKKKKVLESLLELTFDDESDSEEPIN